MRLAWCELLVDERCEWVDEGGVVEIDEVFRWDPRYGWMKEDGG
jgi:hypothetical protein